MNGYEIADKKLLVKVDQKTSELLREHIKKSKMDNDKHPMTKNARKAEQLRQNNSNNNSMGNGEDDTRLNLELVDEDTLRDDRIVLGSFDVILRQYAKDLQPPEENLNEMGGDDSNGNGANEDEFMETDLSPKIENTPSPKIADQKATIPVEKERDKDRVDKDRGERDRGERDRGDNRDRGDKDRGDKERDRDREREREKERERERDRERERERERERDKDRDREKGTTT